MTALLIAGFTGWEIFGIFLWAGIIGCVWWSVRDRKETIAEKDRQWARRHRL